MMDFNDSHTLLSGEELIYTITIPLSTSIILANLVIILGIAWNRQLHNTPNYFFLSLLVADLCTGVALPFIPLMGLNRELSFSSCMVAHIFPNFLFLAFLLNLVMVHYERYICIVDPLHYSNLWMHRSFPLALLVERGSQASDQEHRLNLRYTRCVVAVSLTFLACWVPYLIYMHVCIAFLISDTKWSSTTHIVLSCTGIGSMAVVPLVLGLANRQYTEPAYKLLQKLRDRWRRRTQGAEEVAV
ncbi:G-protein coupled bile acid receptor 1 [Larimichthys crocea]|uniref:G-protein coupled bile acid receptor 1 n=1 Tax=Larimichthys crocea TaxID=215358 RepID=A0A6G0HGQ8_LARCR|nr:G-protein coupled bile acid receptor 1 [Larimichthys crocea]